VRIESERLSAPAENIQNDERFQRPTLRALRILNWRGAHTMKFFSRSQMAMSDNKERTSCLSSFSAGEYIYFPPEDAFESKKQTLGSKLPLIKCTYTPLRAFRKIMMSLSRSTRVFPQERHFSFIHLPNPLAFKCVCIKNAN
jgi:hypothetical protein